MLKFQSGMSHFLSVCLCVTSSSLVERSSNINVTRWWAADEVKCWQWVSCRQELWGYNHHRKRPVLSVSLICIQDGMNRVLVRRKVVRIMMLSMIWKTSGLIAVGEYIMGSLWCFKWCMSFAGYLFAVCGNTYITLVITTETKKRHTVGPE